MVVLVVGLKNWLEGSQWDVALVVDGGKLA